MRGVVFLAVVAAVVIAGCKARVQMPGGAQGSKPDAARKQAETVAVNTTKAAATAQAELLARAGALGPGTNVSAKAPADQKAPVAPANPPASTSPAPPTGATKRPPGATPRPGSPAVIKEHVTSALPAPTEADADEDAIAAAQELIERKLAEQDPPVRYRPTRNEVKHEF